MRFMVLEESNRRCYARNLPMTTSCGVYLNQLTKASTIGMTSLESQLKFKCRNDLCMKSLSNFFNSSNGICSASFSKLNNCCNRIGRNHCPRSAPVGMGSFANQPLRNLTNLQHPYQFPGHLHHSFCSRCQTLMPPFQPHPPGPINAHDTLFNRVSPTQPNSMPAPGSKFMQIQQSPNPYTDFT
ncbi:hypothetical protein Btru_054844 [Bulinus truncatus]|nr:hypothetical protein Btru_054844 [Bulinus truncatus]